MVTETKVKPELLSKYPEFSREFEIDDDLINELMFQTFPKGYDFKLKQKRPDAWNFWA